MGSIFTGLNSLILRMDWLSDLVYRLLDSVVGMDMQTRVAQSLHFFMYDVIKIFILLSVLIFFISYVQSYFPPERTRVILGGMKGIKGNIMGALLGTITPFCSCSSIPIFIGFTSAGLPLGTTFSFLISSPFVDLASLLVLASFFGFKIAIVYVVVGVLLAIAGGTIIEKMGMEKYVEEYVKEGKISDVPLEELTHKDRREYSAEQVKSIFIKVWKFVLIGVGIGAAIHNWIPQNIIENVIGSNNPFAVILAAAVGIPMYADIFGTIPIAEALFLKGVNVGTVLAFMMSVTALSLPSIIMISKVIKRKLLYTFVGIVAGGIILIGYLFNAFSFLLI